MLKRLLVMLLVVGAIFGAIAYVKHRQATAFAQRMATPPPPVTVATSDAKRESWDRYLIAVGTLSAVQGIEVNSEVAGQIAAIHFQSGQEVEAGDDLVQLDASVDRAELEGLEAAVRLTELQFARFAKLLEQGTAVSKSDFDEARARRDEAEALMFAKRAQIRKKTIRAPFSGRLGIREVDVGQYIDPGDPIVPLQQMDPIYVDFSVPERYLREIESGSPVTVKVQSYPEQEFLGRVTAINPGVKAATRNLELQATLPNSEATLRPGMFAEVRISLPGSDEVITVPQTAVTYSPYGESVFVVEDLDGRATAQRRDVTTGRVQRGRVAIATGLKEGEQVVSAGHTKLRNGTPLAIDNSVDLEALIVGP
jgi:membrane fusion protein (multidrug efflux system)